MTHERLRQGRSDYDLLDESFLQRCTIIDLHDRPRPARARRCQFHFQSGALRFPTHNSGSAVHVLQHGQPTDGSPRANSRCSPLSLACSRRAARPRRRASPCLLRRSVPPARRAPGLVCFLFVCARTKEQRAGGTRVSVRRLEQVSGFHPASNQCMRASKQQRRRRPAAPRHVANEERCGRRAWVGAPLA